MVKLLNPPHPELERADTSKAIRGSQNSFNEWFGIRFRVGRCSTIGLLPTTAVKTCRFATNPYGFRHWPRTWKCFWNIYLGSWNEKLENMLTQNRNISLKHKQAWSKVARSVSLTNSPKFRSATTSSLALNLRGIPTRAVHFASI